FERVLFPSVSRAARRAHRSLSVPAVQGCCGALHAHNGELGAGLRMAERVGRRLPGLIVTTSGGCAAHLADVLGSARIADISQLLDPSRLQPLTTDGRRLRVALQDSCHLRNGLGVWREPRALLARIGDYVEVPGAESCCGSAGTYSLLRPTDSARLLEPKLDALEAARVDVVAAMNPGCLRQLRRGLRQRRSPVEAVHLVELVARALHDLKEGS
ncbi:MAG: (Fe-S)-binding protein, partial [Acidimicrobiales bacterium]